VLEGQTGALCRGLGDEIVSTPGVQERYEGAADEVYGNLHGVGEADANNGM
jgi:hypothetical protein